VSLPTEGEAFERGIRIQLSSHVSPQFPLANRDATVKWYAKITHPGIRNGPYRNSGSNYLVFITSWTSMETDLTFIFSMTRARWISTVR